MKKIGTRKLALNRETLRTLDQLHGVVGGRSAATLTAIKALCPSADAGCTVGCPLQ